MESLGKSKWEDLNLSRDEIKNIGEALKKDEFRSLLLEYVKEINDPENRKQYEKEITQLENERGVDVKFVHPTAGYVIKTSVDGKSKAFINVCSNINVGKPTARPVSNADGKHGLSWSIPHCLVPPREDFDKKNNVCVVYDAVFHPDTLHLTQNNVAFKRMVNSVALEAVENSFHVNLDKINLKFPNIQFKGVKHATVIRNKIKTVQPTEYVDIPNYPYPHIKENVQHEERIYQPKQDELKNAIIDSQYATPKYCIKHRKNFDFQDYTNDSSSSLSITVPDELEIVIDLPLLKYSTDASIDVTETFLCLISESPAKYKLHLKLPYYVNSNKGSAKFDIMNKVLTVTLPIVKNKGDSKLELAREDSGVESDNGCEKSNSMSSDDEDGINKELSRNKGPVEGEFESSTEGNFDYKTFLKSNVHYILPKFSCQLLKDVLSFTFQVQNVDPETVEYCFLNNNSGFHLVFDSVGAGFVPVNYAMYMLLISQIQIDNDVFNVEVWDNIVTAQVKLKSSNQFVISCYIGTDKNKVEKISIRASEEAECNYTQKDENATSKLEEVDDDFIRNEDQERCILAQSVKFHSELERDGQKLVSKIKTSKKNETEKFLNAEQDNSVLEDASSFDKSISYPHQHPAKSRTLSENNEGETRRNRGILKIGRSLSESSVDDYASWSAEKMEKTKKTVRFSEVISKQTFRMNSSILGQRKKNQRKMKNKKRAQERRLSESGCESEGENEVASMKSKDSSNQKEIDLWLIEPDSSSCDVSDMSEISDISESDDGQKDESIHSMPCSSKKNHKRRGKKSARKNAATAKFQFMEN